MTPEAITSLYVSVHPGLVRFLSSQGDAAEAPDLAQATWAHFCEVVSSRPVSEPTRFLYTVARWKAHKHRRFRSRTGRLLRDPPGDDHPVLTPVSGTSKTRRITGSDNRARGQKSGRAKYPDSMALTLREAYVRLGSYGAVARETGVSKPTVMRFLKGTRKVASTAT